MKCRTKMLIFRGKNVQKGKIVVANGNEEVQYTTNKYKIAALSESRGSKTK
jgi:hypothetical protein